jgi:hypothetical protein
LLVVAGFSSYIRIDDVERVFNTGDKNVSAKQPENITNEQVAELANRTTQ